MPDRADDGVGKDGLAVIVVGVDGSTPAQNAAAWAVGLARRERARLVLVYVESLTAAAYWSPMGLACAVEASSTFVKELHQAAADILDEAGVRWELVHYRGDPAQGLELVAEQRRADCIVIGRARHRASGSVPRRLLNDAKRPVVVIP
jgi:nucleotide-binding universal stress UspA family protein